MRVAVVGAGPSGSSFALTLIASARAFDRKLEVTLYDGGLEHTVSAPALIDGESLCRLSSLDAPIPEHHGVLDVQGVALHVNGTTSVIDMPSGALRILDGRPGYLPGCKVVKEALLAAAVGHGISICANRVDSVERIDESFVVRARGRADKYGLVVGAFGPRSELSAHWLDGHYCAPPLKIAAHARITWPVRDRLVRLHFSPTPDVDLLEIFPTPGSEAYLVAIGNNVTTAKLAHALAVLLRDQAILGNVEIVASEKLLLATGATRSIARGKMITIGAAALGAILEPGLSFSLLHSIRCAKAIAETSLRQSLKSPLWRSTAELRKRASLQMQLLKWIGRAGSSAVEEIHNRDRMDANSATGLGGRIPLVGIPYSTMPIVLSSLRRDWLLRHLSRPSIVAPLASYRRDAAGSENESDEKFVRRSASGDLPLETNREPNPIVFVVDDDPDARALLVSFLEQRGLRAKAFPNELNLLEAAAHEHPPAILLDIVLRYVDGLSLCRALRTHRATSGTRLILTSNLFRQSDRLAALRAGADAFLPKPIDFAELERLLEGLFPGQRSEALAQRQHS